MFMGQITWYRFLLLKLAQRLTFVPRFIDVDEEVPLNFVFLDMITYLLLSLVILSHICDLQKELLRRDKQYGEGGRIAN